MDAQPLIPLAPPQGVRSKPAGSRLPRRAWLRDAVYFAVLGACMLLVAFFAVVRTVSEPRAAIVGDAMIARLGALREAYLMLPASQRLGYLQEVARTSGHSLVLDDPGRWGMADPDSVLSQAVFRHIRALQPDAILGFSRGKHPQVWFALQAGDGDLVWVRVPVSSPPDDAISLVASLLAALALVVMLGMLYLGWRSRHEIRNADRALGVLGSLLGSGSPAHDATARGASPARPTGRSLEELVAAMSGRLTRMHKERGRVLQQAADELRQAVAPWVQHPQALAHEARACTVVMQIGRVASQFERFAHDWASEAPVLADLGALVERVVDRVSPGVTLALAPLPPLLLRSHAMEQLVGQVLDNALSHGGGRVVVTLTQEGEELVLRVLDGGEPVDNQALAMVGRPFFRGNAARHEGLGAGLGVALSRQIAQLHAGELRVDCRIGGGLVVQVRLPLARAESAEQRAPRSDGFGRQRPAWSALLGDVVLLVALFAGAIALNVHIFSRIVVPTYIDSAASVMAGEIEGISAGYAALPPPLRPAYLHALGRYSEGRLQVADPSGFEMGGARIPAFQSFVERLRGRLPGVAILVSPWPRSVLWVALPGGGDSANWLAISARPYGSGMLPVLGSMAVLLVTCACLLLLRARRGLVQGVTHSSAPRQLHDPLPCEDDSQAQQMRDLKQRIDQVSQSLAQAKGEQDVLLQRLTRDLRERLAALRQAGRHLPLDTGSLEGIARAVERLDQLAGHTPETHP